MQKDRFYTTQSFPIDPREWDPYKGVRIFSDMFQLEDWTGFATATVGAEGTTPSASSTFSFTDPSGPVAGTSFVGIGNAKAAGAKSELRDRTSSSIDPGIVFGVYEMDYLVRARFTSLTAVETMIRLGFYDDVADLAANESKNGLYFYIKNQTSVAGTLRVGIFKNWTGTASATSYRFLKDTGIKMDTYKTLGIYVNKDATDVVFTVDGTIVHRQSNDIPNRLTMTTASERCQVGAAMQATATTTTGVQLELDYMQYRAFVNRGV
jgi:hypothetical protein